jgi:hypothetical protein
MPLARHRVAEPWLDYISGLRGVTMMLILQIIGGVGLGILSLRLLSVVRQIADFTSGIVTSGFDLRKQR